MDIDSILEDVATDTGMTSEEVREANVGDVFKRDEFEFYLNYEDLLKFVENYLGDGYYFDYRCSQSKLDDIYSIFLVRKLEDKSTDKEEVSVREFHQLESEVLELRNEEMLGMDEDDVDPEITKVGNILEKVKQVYEQMETSS